MLEKGIELDRIVLNKDDVTYDLSIVTCKICNLVPLTPEICKKCQQIYCDTCIKKHLQNKNKTCPNCNSKYIKDSPIEKHQQIFNNMQITCVFFQLGCDDVLLYNDLKNHQNDCKIKQKDCENCNSKFSYLEYNDHSINCSQSIIKCMQCNFKETKLNYDKTENLINHIQHRLIDSVQNFFKEEINNMKNDLKDYIDQKINSQNKEDPFDKINQIKFSKDICNNADNNFQLENKFAVFKNFIEENLIVWGNQNYEIEVYNLDDDKSQNVIKKAHDSNILSLSHCQDFKNKSTYLLSSAYDRSLKVWNVEDKWKNVIHIQDAHSDYSIFSCNLLYHHIEQKVYLISSNYKEKIIKIWNFEKECINQITEKGVRFMTHYFEKDSNKYYLVFCLNLEVNSYDFSDLSTIYKSYMPNEPAYLTSAIVHQEKLLSSDLTGKINIWNFHSGEIIKSITRGNINTRISSISLMGDNYLLCASDDKSILMFDLEESKLIKNFKDHTSEVFCIKVFNLTQNSKCLLSYGFDSKIKLWK